MHGHAIEVRLYAEDPYAGFAPQTGTVLHWRPQSALQPGVRIDHGIAEGGTVSPFYDAMVAKLIAHGRDRDDALRRLRAALAATPLLGLKNNARYLHDLLDHPTFRRGETTTAWLDAAQAGGDALNQAPAPGDEDWCLAASAFALRDGTPHRPDSVAAYDLALACGEQRVALRVRPGEGGRVQVALAGASHAIRLIDAGEASLRYEWQGVQRSVVARWCGDGLHLARDAHGFVFTEPSVLPRVADARDPRRALAPVAGVVAKLAVKAGDAVEAGQPLACVEAMKMEMWVSAGAAGQVARVAVSEGRQVAAGALLVELEIP